MIAPPSRCAPGESITPEPVRCRSSGEAPLAPDKAPGYVRHHCKAEAIEALGARVKKAGERRSRDRETGALRHYRAVAFGLGGRIVPETGPTTGFQEGPTKDLYVDTQFSIEMHVFASLRSCQHLITDATAAVQFC